MKVNLTNLILRIFWFFENLTCNFDMTVNLRQEVESLTQKKLGRNRILIGLEAGNWHWLRETPIM